MQAVPFNKSINYP